MKGIPWFFMSEAGHEANILTSENVLRKLTVEEWPSQRGDQGSPQSSDLFMRITAETDWRNIYTTRQRNTGYSYKRAHWR
jgi:hypothetical protein